MFFRAFLGSTPATAAPPKFKTILKSANYDRQILPTKTVPDSCPPLQGECRRFDPVELFADKSGLGLLEAKFKIENDDLSNGRCVPNAVPLLRYFLRVDPKVGERQVHALIDARKVTGCYPTLLEDLGKSLPTVEQLAISDLDDADLEVSTSAARALGRWGTAKVEPALWARLRRFHQEWPIGVGELTLTDKDTSARVQALDNLETTLTHSIVSGTNLDLRSRKIRAAAHVSFVAAPERLIALD